MKHRLTLSTVLAGIFLLAPGFAKAEEIDGGACSESLSEATDLIEIDKSEMTTAIAEEDLENVGTTLLPTSTVWKTKFTVEGYTYTAYYWNGRNGECHEELIEQKEVAQAQ